jgi:hypothetical protein
VKSWLGLGLALLAGVGHAATAYVTDELVLGVYSEQNTQGQRLATLHSGATVETLAVNGEATQVRLPGGIVGWVKSSYLTNVVPATLRLKEMQDELDRVRATTPGLAEAAERSEVARLTRELELRDAAAPAVAPAAAGGAAVARTSGPAVPARSLWPWVVAIPLSLGCGFWLGHALLARRIRQKFGGLKVY